MLATPFLISLVAYAFAATCGDGTWESGSEECDDSNLIAGDGCDASCAIEDGYTCTNALDVNTGGDGAGGTYGVGDSDRLWEWSAYEDGSGPTAAIVSGNCASDYWETAPTNADWINRSGCGTDTPEETVTYYSTSFELGSASVAASTVLSGTIWADNSVYDILVNGNSTGVEFGPSGYAGAGVNFGDWPSAYYQAGTNTITVAVYNDTKSGPLNPDGLLVSVPDVYGVGSLCEVTCGDGTLESFESCDDGNTTDGDGCSSICVTEEVCNGEDDDLDGLVDNGFADTDSDGTADCVDTEDCDGVDNDGDGTIDEFYADTDFDGVADCVDTETCDGFDNDGDGLVDEAYADTDGDGTADCVDIEECDGTDNDGDGQVDEGVAGCGDVAVCGDGLWASLDEECDDGNTTDGDGCDASCAIEDGYTCTNALDVNTGGDGAGGTYGVGDSDRLWEWSAYEDGSGPTAAIVSGDCAEGSWVPEPSAARWINRAGCGTTTPEDTVTYYSVSFELGSAAVAASTVLSGTIWADNSVYDILVNGNSTGVEFGPSGYTGAGVNFGDWPSAYYQAGTNTISIAVYNAFGTVGNPDGLLVSVPDVYGVGSLCEVTCGDGALETFESCDDGNTTDGDGCSSTCVTEETCNGEDDDLDGVVDNGFADTDGDGTADCVDAEECDGLDNDGDGTIDELYADTDYDGVADCVDAEECDGFDNNGNGLVDETYADTDGDGTADCVDIEECDGTDNDGDGQVDEGVAGCGDVAVCGDGLWASLDEECDDGNTTDGDGCDASCAIEDGYTCTNALDVNTGGDGAGGTYGVGDSDRLWEWSAYEDGSGPTAAIVSGDCAPGFWTSEPSAARWINRYGCGTSTPEDTVTYYSVSFDLASASVAASTVLSGTLWADNSVYDILVNGNSTGVEFGPSGYTGAGVNFGDWPSAYYQAGTNTITVAVYNAFSSGALNPDGLLVSVPGAFTVASVCEVTCGDGALETFESCDDGNTTDGDGCSSTCVTEEVCNGEDDDLDGVVDNGFADTDSDGTADCVDAEECDGLDNDGDGTIDEDFADTDGDGVVDCLDSETCDGLDNDGDGFTDEAYADTDGDGTADCVDTEECDGLDNDGDESIDELYADTDGDGTADCVDVEECDGVDNNGDGRIDEGSADTDGDGTADCLDSETCDGLDNNGDGSIDEDFTDTDGDGAADCVDSESCDGIDNDGDGSIDEDFIDTDGDGIVDCLDSETCDGVDNNGDGSIDEDFADTDGDGNADCVDSEICDGVDNNGDGLTDEDYADTDGDGIADCVDAGVCGDGIWDSSSEQCDDGGQVDADGCDAACAVEEGYTCLNSLDVNSGGDGAGGQAAIGDADRLWTWSEFADGSGATPAIVAGDCAPGSWVDEPVNSRWVNRYGCATSTPENTLTYYSVSFDLASEAVASSTVLAGTLWADNAVEDILVNGISTGVSFGPDGYTGVGVDFGDWPSTFYQAGTNTITVVVYNAFSSGALNPDGLLVSVPEAFTLASECAITCGDGTVETWEACDDGNTVNGDGCSAACAIEELCNGLDDDMDGEIDNGFADTDGDGLADCVDSEECDGLDNDGDGEVDNGFPDTNENGVADCLEPVDTGDSGEPTDTADTSIEPYYAGGCTGCSTKTNAGDGAAAGLLLALTALWRRRHSGRKS